MKKILVPVDFNPLATAALEYAAQIASRAGATLIVMYADTFEPPIEFTAVHAESLAAAIEESRAKTAEELAEYVHEHVPETLEMETEVREALPVPAILAAIAQHGPDLVVMGTHGRGGLSRLLFGSVTEAVLRDASVPVLTMNRTDAALPPRMVVCVDGSAEEMSSEMAALFGAQCRNGGVDEADLIVTGETSRALTRHARAPVLHVRART